ncbi:GspH/FimT family pseudopilin [uncultured Microbulbifer sp.]|uniref:GspH/FimT family pseudopilin n=1 Tax=uncultured Microbulbifer sp. TaxID=348147 RepID=UPI002619916B|nr:GspH/FimT family pseudopilin [uncultured Microbulbifer sp.]
MNNTLCKQGFTLIELMVVVTVLGIVVAMGIPSFGTLIDNNRMSVMTNDLNSTLQYARSEAVRRAGAVRVTAIDDDIGNGLRVWIDNGNNTYGDDGDIELRVLEVDAKQLALAAKLADASAVKIDFSFNARGENTLGATLVLGLCDDRKGNYGRRLELLASGALRLAKDISCNGDEETTSA